jgi:hypothetical protein
MLETLRAGDRVRSNRQPKRGIGAVVYTDASTAVVYFKDRTKTVPEAALRVPAADRDSRARARRAAGRRVRSPAAIRATRRQAPSRETSRRTV